MIHYRQMTAEDIPAGLNLCRAAGWNQLHRDWGLFLSYNPTGAHIAVNEDNLVVGTATTLRYQDKFSWIGMVLVDPDFRKMGIGTTLMREAMNTLTNEYTIKLDATPDGRKVYRPLGFEDEYPITRMHLASAPYSISRLPGLRKITIQDLPLIAEADRIVFGADRTFMLSWIHEGNPAQAYLIENQGHLKGYCFARPGHNFTQIGPVVADDFRLASELVSAAMSSSQGKPLILDILHHTPDWDRWVKSMGFMPLRLLTRMFKGSNHSPGNPLMQFAILGPESG